MPDICVIGTGPVGATLALALADSGLEVVALDARAQGAILRGDRSLALSHGARLIFDRLGVWTPLAAMPGAVTPITRIDVSQAGGFGTVALDANDVSLPALGYVVSYIALQGALDAALERRRVDVRYGVPVDRVDATPSHARVVPTSGADALAARLAVAADGAGAGLAGIERVRRDYGQVAVIGKVETSTPHGGLAYERFTPDGPIALLPEGGHYAFVWTLAPRRAQELLAMPEDAFVDRFAAGFGRRRSDFVRAWGRRSFPLALEFARPAVARRIVAIGNASQTLHPVAGQGFNVGLRDAWELKRAISASPREAIGTRPMLDAYAARRRPDRWAGIAFTHGLVHLFGTDLPFVRWPRGLGLALLDAIPPLKRTFTRAMLFGA
ncbi:2-octaprenyl-6-methoxyphenol hydroxylase [Burkholderiales bacterium]|nr:2-octaprenyl-6-methoxyphenol hydroxylase [Burkholderiales bacterium]